MAEFAALPLFTDSLLADTGHLSDDEFGRYIRLLIITWRSPGCRIPNDSTWIAKRLRLQPLQYESLIAPLINEFYANDGNWLMQKRLSKEFLHVREKVKKRSDAAKSRWQKQKKPCKSNAPTPSPTPSIDNTNVLSSVELGMWFENFWNAYPGRGKDGASGNGFKGSKAKAREKFETLLRQLKGKDQYENFIAGLRRGAEAYAEHLDRSGYPSKHTVTWLNQRGWEDDYSGTGARAGASGGTKTDRARAAMLKSATDLGIA